MQDKNGEGLGVSQVATAYSPLWPLNEELCELTGSSPPPWPWGASWWAWERHLALGVPPRSCLVPWMFMLPQSSGIWF